MHDSHPHTDGEEMEKLLDSTASEKSSNKGQLSKVRQWALIFTILFLLLSSLCVDTMIFPFFPAIARNKGLSDTAIGVVFSSYDFSRFVASPISGSLLTRWHPKSMCAFGNIIAALSCIAFGVVNVVRNQYIFLTACVVVRCTAGVGSAMLTVAGTSMLMKSTNYEPSTIGGILEIMISLGFATGPAIGVLLYSLVGYLGMFCLLGGLMLGFIPVYTLVVPKIETEESEQKGNFLSLMTLPGCLLVFLSFTLTKLINSAINSTVSNFEASNFDTSPSEVGLQFVAWSTVCGIGTMIITKLFDKRYSFHIMLAGWIFMLIPILLVGPSPLLGFIFHGQGYKWLTFFAVATVYALDPMIYIPSYQAALDQAIVNGYEKDNLHTYGLVAGLVNSGMSLGSTIAPVISGALTDDLGFPWAMTSIATTNVLMVPLIITFLIYMKCTGQRLLMPSVESREELQSELPTAEWDETDTMQDKISAACTDRMNRCLSNPEMLKNVYEQPPLLDE